MRLTALCLGTVVLSFLFGEGTLQAGTIRDDVSPQIYASIAASADYASVGLIIEQQTTGGSTVGSATLIAPNVVLTAAHLLNVTAPNVKFRIQGQDYFAEQIVSNPNWSANNLGQGYDIGLIKLSSSVTGIAPAVRYSGNQELGMLATFVGYGLTGTGLTGYDNTVRPFDGYKRAGTNVLDAYFLSGSGTNDRIMISDFDRPSNNTNNYSGSATASRFEFLTGLGDSGGGVFAKTELGTVLVGVNSFGFNPSGTVVAGYGEVAGTTRVSSYNSWIDSVLLNFNGSSGLGSGLLPLANGLPAPVPEPTSGVLLLVGIALFGWGRRRGGV